MRISVFGMGYVGTVSAACLTQRGHNVICIDKDPQKVELLANAKSPIVEDGVEQLLQSAGQQGRLAATECAESAVAESDLSIICVGTPSRPNGSLNLSYVERVCDEIGQAIASKDSWHDVVIRSTMLPGSTDNIVIPALERHAGPVGEKFGVAINPEFLREGSAVYDYANPPKTVIGRVNQRTAETVDSLFADLPGPMIHVDYRVAETVKYVDNVWHALKVAFANEVGRVCQSSGIDSRIVMNVFKQDTKLNISDKYLSPGFAFGGSCLPKDVRALTYYARQQDQTVPILNAINASNRVQIDHGIDLVRKTNNRNIGIFGFAFKAGTDDLRESPMIEMIERLSGKGYNLKIFDGSVNVAFLRGANRQLLLDKIPHIADLMVDSPAELFSHADTIVIGNAARELADLPEDLWTEKDVVDLADVLDAELIPILASYAGTGWV